MSDGGEGLLDVLGGANRTTVVTGSARRAGRGARGGCSTRTAVIEMARASGLELAGGAGRQRPDGGHDHRHRRADRPGARAGRTTGSSSASAGRRRPTAGSARSRRSRAPARLRARRARRSPATCATRFVDAAAVFAPQKGATPAQVASAHAPGSSGSPRRTRDEYGVDVRAIDGQRRRRRAGRRRWPRSAAGWSPGFDLVADEVDLHDRLDGADVVVTGEGYLDEQSFEGKVVGGVVDVRDRGRRCRSSRSSAMPTTTPTRRRIAERRHARRAVRRLDRADREPLWCIEHAALRC